eukprot:9170207-Pyramimonas_sp.AAC.2
MFPTSVRGWNRCNAFNAEASRNVWHHQHALTFQHLRVRLLTSAGGEEEGKEREIGHWIR